MSIIKFNEKNKAIYGKIESTPGTYESGIAAADCVASTSITGSVTYETGSYQYLGDSNSRDEFTYQKDTYADITFETPQQILVTLDPALLVADIPLSKHFRACGATVTVDGGTGVVTITNNTVDSSKLSFNFNKSSSDDVVYQKLYKFFSMWGMCDVSADVGNIPQLKFNFKGNAYPPVMAPVMTPDYGNQTTAVSSTVRLATIVEAKFTPLGENFEAQSVITGTPTITHTGAVATVTLASHGLVQDQRVNISGATGAVDGYYYNGDFQINYLTANTFSYTMVGTPGADAAGTLVAKKDGYAKTFCFSTLQAPNFFGFELTRYLTGCEEGFDRKAVPSDVNVTMLESHSPAFAVTTITKSGTTATVTTDVAHGLTAGMSVTISGATDPLYNITGLIASSATGTTFTYILGATPASNAVASSNGTLRVVNNSSTTFDPDAHVTEFFAAKVKFGTAAGRYTTYEWTKLQLSNVKDGKVATSEGRDITFRSTGKSSIILS